MTSSWETIVVDGQSMDVYLSMPDQPGPFPAVVVSHHGGGVDQFIRETTDRLAAEGYVVAAPNLFHRFSVEMLAERTQRVQHMSDPDIIADINATVDFLQEHKSVNGQRIGITGFCMGGRVTWLAAATIPNITAAVPYYGGNLMVTWGQGKKTPFDLADGINCPVLFHFGEVDENPSQEDIRKLDDALTRMGKTHRFYTYPGADHAFMDYTAARYQKAASEISWPRTLEFFSQHLKIST